MQQNKVGFLKTDSKARYQGYQFYFREGFCWTNILNPNARLLKTKLKGKSVNDVGSMALISILEKIPNHFFVSLLNSNFLFDYYRDFINCTVNIQINDIRQLPIKIPTAAQLEELTSFFETIVAKKKEGNELEVTNLETKLDNKIYELYNIIEPFNKLI